MSDLQIRDFRRGLDVRRSPATTEQNSLLICQDAHITSGGEIEQRYGFIPWHDLPAGQTRGLMRAGEHLYVFGTKTDVSLPPDLQYQQLQHPTDPDCQLLEILDSASFNGLPYVIALFDDQSICHFYDGKYVEAWEKITSLRQIRNFTDLAQYFKDEIGGIKALADLKVTLSTTSATNNSKMLLRLTAPKPDMPLQIAVSTENRGTDKSQSLKIIPIQSASQTDPEITEIHFSGIYENRDIYRLDILGKHIRKNGFADTIPTQIMVYGEKLYAASRNIVFFSAIREAMDWQERDDGDGFLSISSHPGGDQALSGMAVQGGGLAFFTHDHIQVWFLDPDPEFNQRVRTLFRTGCIAPKSIVEYGDENVFFLSQRGIRSLSRREMSNNPYVADLGTPIQELLIDHIAQLDPHIVQSAVAEITPDHGRYWLWLDDVVYVLSHFPENNILAWSLYRPGFRAEQLISANHRLIIRSGDRLYRYGGESGREYDDSLPIVQLPFLHGHHLHSRKFLKSLDFSCEGSWRLRLCTNPAQSEQGQEAGIISGFSALSPQIPITGQYAYLSPHLTGCGTPPHKLHNLNFYYMSGGSAK